MFLSFKPPESCFCVFTFEILHELTDYSHFQIIWSYLTCWAFIWLCRVLDFLGDPHAELMTHCFHLKNIKSSRAETTSTGWNLLYCSALHNPKTQEFTGLQTVCRRKQSNLHQLQQFVWHKANVPCSRRQRNLTGPPSCRMLLIKTTIWESNKYCRAAGSRWAAWRSLFSPDVSHSWQENDGVGWPSSEWKWWTSPLKAQRLWVDRNTSVFMVGSSWSVMTRNDKDTVITSPGLDALHHEGKMRETFWWRGRGGFSRHAHSMTAGATRLWTCCWFSLETWIQIRWYFMTNSCVESFTFLHLPLSLLQGYKTGPAAFCLHTGDTPQPMAVPHADVCVCLSHIL